MEEFVVDFIGDTFAFSVALSDHGPEFLHEMARTHHAIAKEAKLGSVGTNFSGVQLLEMFMDQLGPNPKNPRKGIGILGLTGPEGRAIAFYPKMPPGFDDTSEANDYSYKITVPGTAELDPATRIAELELIVAAKPSDPEPYCELAARYSRQGRLPDCIRCLEEAIKHATPSANVHGLLGETLAEIGRNDEGAAHFQKATDLEPNNASAHRGLGVCLLRVGDSENTSLHFEAAARLDPEEWRNHSNLGFALASAGKHDEAIASYKRAVAIAPNEIDNRLRARLVV